MIQTVMMAQALYAKAALVDHAALVASQRSADLVKAEQCLQDAFAVDVRPAVGEWRGARGLPQDPIDALRQSGYVQRISKERGARPPAAASSYA
jgi:L-rhamnose isomerase/sugar isomerase